MLAALLTNLLSMLTFRNLETYFKRLGSSFSSNSPKTLYKFLLRQCEKLPIGPKEHYRFQIKQSFKQHINEADPIRIKQIIDRSYKDTDWVLKKYLEKNKK